MSEGFEFFFFLVEFLFNFIFHNRIRSSMSSKKMPRHAFLVLLRNRGGPMLVQSSLLKG